MQVPPYNKFRNQAHNDAKPALIIIILSSDLVYVTK